MRAITGKGDLSEGIEAECWAGTRRFSRSGGSGSSREKKGNIKVKIFAKIDIVTIDIELTSFIYGVGRTLGRFIRGLVT